MVDKRSSKRNVGSPRPDGTEPGGAEVNQQAYSGLDQVDQVDQVQGEVREESLDETENVIYLPG